jgi:voltage-gated potassium channel
MISRPTVGRSAQLYTKFVWAGIALVAIMAVGSLGYWFIGGRQHSLLDAFYMTLITISTIGYAEIVDLSNNPAGRVFTIFIALSGIGTLFYIITNVTAFAIEGKLTDSFRRQRMEKRASGSTNHYIVCGIGWVAFHVVNELRATKRPLVVVDLNRNQVEETLEDLQDIASIEGDATDNDTLLKAGIMRAKGLFAVTGDDNQNLVISLTAKQLNPEIRVIARCNEIRNTDKMKKAGADSVVSTTLIGGLRIASEMIRPTAVSFLDVMLRDREKNLRVEEIPVSESFVGKSLATLNLRKYRNVLLLAIKKEEEWVYNPLQDYLFNLGDTLVLLASPDERMELEKFLNSG